MSVAKYKALIAHKMPFGMKSFTTFSEKPLL